MVKWEYAHAPVGREVIAAVERFLKIQFPEDYVECALVNHGGTPTPNELPNNASGSCVQSLLHYTEPPSWRYRDTAHILETYSIVYSEQGRLPIQVFPFAYDPGGNLFAFDYRDSPEAPTVIFLDHEEEDDFGHFPSSFVANSFTEFLGLLEDFEYEIQ
jgi:hypothetical protein